MVNNREISLDNVFAALSDPTRRAILRRLSYGTASVTELAEPFASEMSLPAISKHLRVLETAGLIAREKEGRIHHLRLRSSALRDAAEWLSFYRQFWEEQFDSLSQYLDEAKDDAESDETDA